MFSHRHLKQAMYALGYLFFWALLGLFFVFIVVRPSFGPTSTPTPSVLYEDIIVEQVENVRHDNRVDIVARLRNPNPRAGTGQYVVTFVLFDSQDKEAYRHTESTYILPGSVQYVVAINVPTPQDLARIQVITPRPQNFMRLPDGKELPTFSSFLRDRSIKLVNNIQLEEQKAIVLNTSTIDWERVEVAGVALSSAGKIIGVSKTFVGLLRAGEQREFTLQWPAPAVPTERVIVIPTTNIYSEENIVKIIGDPGLLR